jgi:hypothetical protein
MKIKRGISGLILETSGKEKCLCLIGDTTALESDW